MKKPKQQKMTTTTKAKSLAPAAKTKPQLSQHIIPPRSTPRTLSVDVMDFEQYAHAGQEEMTRADLMIPRLTILQDLSPQVKDMVRHIEGAEPGDICDIVTGELFSGEEGILFLFAAYRRTYIEWVPRKKGGGFVADHGHNLPSDAIQGEKGSITRPNGNEIKTVAEYMGFYVDVEQSSYKPFVIGMTGTQLKKARRLNTMINQLRVPTRDGRGTFNPPIFYRLYKLTTVPERNDQGSWFGWQIEPDMLLEQLPFGLQLYQEVLDFRKAIKEGTISAAAPVEQESGLGEDSDLSPM